ncbi:hypothetical protein NPIL_99851 [Nephila pilipes]|uniref:Uncharacterized protein n=1 Tax=Nephila pilipes TaxID=299642 RepID=A0A8X6NRL0_NEPPI|nr:hypothetical protein NPIL_99851 [Nephila pilipes]
MHMRRITFFTASCCYVSEVIQNTTITERDQREIYVGNFFGKILFQLSKVSRYSRGYDPYRVKRMNNGPLIISLRKFLGCFANVRKEPEYEFEEALI